MTSEEINKIFHETQLEDNYNFLASDLIKLANAFIAKARPEIIQECVDVAHAYNTLVADKIKEVLL
jgi:hypothetical protein